MEYAGSVSVILVLIMTSMGGLGGGGAIIPIAIFFYGFETKQAIALSNSSYIIACLYRYLFNFRKSHPLKDGRGVLVDYNTASLMLPMIMVGATLGVKFNQILPSIVVTFILVILLLFILVTTCKKLLKISAEERKKFGPVCGKKNKVDVDGEDTDTKSKNDKVTETEPEAGGTLQIEPVAGHELEAGDQENDNECNTARVL
jgi:uncharacterized membrane protein YfcA